MRETNLTERILLWSELGKGFRSFRRRLEKGEVDYDDLKDALVMLCHNRKRREAILDVIYWAQELDGESVDLETGEVVVRAAVGPKGPLREIVDAVFSEALSLPPKEPAAEAESDAPGA